MNYKGVEEEFKKKTIAKTVQALNKASKAFIETFNKEAGFELRSDSMNEAMRLAAKGTTYRRPHPQLTVAKFNNCLDNYGSFKGKLKYHHSKIMKDVINRAYDISSNRAAGTN